jgi:hypothetical protein
MYKLTIPIWLKYSFVGLFIAIGLSIVSFFLQALPIYNFIEPIFVLNKMITRLSFDLLSNFPKMIIITMHPKELIKIATILIIVIYGFIGFILGLITYLVKIKFLSKS